MNDGFFFDPNEVVGKRIFKTSSLEDNPCILCGLHKGLRSPMMAPFGKNELGIMIVGEAPGRIEDMEGIPFIGESGDRIKRVFKKLGISVDRDCIRTNVLQCRPPDNIFDDNKVEFCYHRLERQILEYKPRLIFTFGQKASKRIIDNRIVPGLFGKESNFSTIHGDVYPICKYNAWVSVNWHPAFIARNEPSDYDLLFEQDIQKGLLYLDKKFPKSIVNNSEFIWCNEKLALDVLSYRGEEEASLDFETNGLNRFASNFIVWCISFSFDGKTGYVIPLEPYNENVWIALESFMKSKVSKCCHKFDIVTAMSILGGMAIRNWRTDPMISQHILDERPDKKSLEYQTFVICGEEYKDIVDRNNFGEELIKNKKNAVKYSALDAIVPVHTSRTHWRELKRTDLVKPMEFLMRGNSALAQMEYDGVKISESEYNRFRDEVDGKRAEVDEYFKKSGIVKEFKKTYGQSLDIMSTMDMKKLFFKMLKLKPLSVTDKGNPQVNDAFYTWLAGEKDEIGEFAEKVQLKKSLDTLSGTFLNSIVKYVDDNWVLHPTYNLWIPRTYRSSCDSPNLQNTPKRDDYMKNFRRMFVPENDFFLEGDFKGAEVTIQAILAQDKALLKQVNDKWDLHKYWASRLYYIESMKDVSKEDKFDGKNRFVFPNLYGAYWENVAELLPRVDKNHVKEVTDEFYEMYSGVRRWQNQTKRFYETNGYVELATGFIRRGHLTFNQVVNTPIQGTTFHCLLDTLICLIVNKELKRAGLKSRARLQVHDSILFDVIKSEAADLIEIVNYFSSEKPWDWYKGAKLTVEWQKGFNWLDMEDCELKVVA
jgi:uracil-DNA glycosylase family 4